MEKKIEELVLKHLGLTTAKAVEVVEEVSGATLIGYNNGEVVSTFVSYEDMEEDLFVYINRRY